MKMIDKKQNILKTWRKVKLGDIIEIRRGASPRPIHEFIAVKGMPWLKIADITSTQSRYVHNTKEFIKNDGVSKSVTVKHGDLILSNSATPGIPRFMRITACIHDGWLLLKPNENQIDKDFLYYRLIIDQPKLVSSVTGSIFNNLNTDILREHEVQLPSIVEQKRIANILSVFDDKIELNNKINQNLEQMAQVIFKESFIKFKFPGYKKTKFVDSELGKIPKGWGVKDLKDLIIFLNRGISPNYVSSSEKGIPVINQKCIRDGLIIFKDIQFANPPQRIDNPRILKSFDILINSMGAGTLGRISRALTINDSLWIHGCITIVRADDKNCLQEFLYRSLKSREKEIEFLGEGSTGQTSLKKEVLENLKLIISPISLQREFSKIQKSFNLLIDKNQKENQKLASFRDLLLPKLMSGEIRA